MKNIIAAIAFLAALGGTATAQTPQTDQAARLVAADQIISGLSDKFARQRAACIRLDPPDEALCRTRWANAPRGLDTIRQAAATGIDAIWELALTEAHKIEIEVDDFEWKRGN